MASKVRKKSKVREGILKEYAGKDPQELQSNTITNLCNAICETEGPEALEQLLEEHIKDFLYAARKCGSTMEELRENMRWIRKFRDSLEDQEL